MEGYNQSYTLNDYELNI